MSASPRAATGIPGLDSILAGGFPRDRLYLVQGDPGVGKTTLALQFLMEGVRQGESCLYLTLSETIHELQGVADSHGWSLDKIRLFELTPPDVLGPEEENTLFHPAEVELAESTKKLLDVVKESGAQRVVIDSLSELRLLAQSPLRYRRQILALKNFFVGRHCTVLLLDDRTSEPTDLQLQSLAHGVVSLEQLSPQYGPERRRLRVLKLRGVHYRGGYHDCNIERGGLVVFPRLVAAEHHAKFGEAPLKSGVPALDALTGGGLDPGTSTLLVGPAGSGKSVLSTQFAVAAANSGLKAMMFLFEENLSTLIHRSATLGLDLAEHRKAGRIALRQIDPAEMSPGEFVTHVRNAVDKENAKVVVIDSLNGYLNSMPEEHFLILQLHELLSYLAQQGVITMMVVAQHGLVGMGMATPVDVSYLADSVILLRHFEAGGRIRRAVSMLKKRSGQHETSIREMIFDKGGIRLGPPLSDFQGVLTGVPRYVGENDPLLRHDREKRES
jgi:circadian clock protein KaiC